jgi:hypothetical protein
MGDNRAADNHKPCQAGLGDADMDAAFAKAAVAGQWFVAVAYVEADGHAQSEIKTSAFPTNRFGFAVQKYRGFVFQEEARAGVENHGVEGRLAFNTLLGLVDTAEQNNVIDKAEANRLNQALANVNEFVDKIAEHGVKKQPTPLPEPSTPDIYRPPGEPGEN